MLQKWSGKSRSELPSRLSNASGEEAVLSDKEAVLSEPSESNSRDAVHLPQPVNLPQRDHDHKPSLDRVTGFAPGYNDPALRDTLMAAGCAEAQRCGVFVEDLQDFISEYLVGCWLSPNRVNLPLTCVCGANRARSFLRRERLWQQRVVLLEPEQLPSLVEAQKEAIALTPEGQVLLGELQSRIEVARGELSALQQQVFYLRCFEGLLFREIAVQTGQSIAAAKMAFRSGQHRLSAVFEIGESAL